MGDARKGLDEVPCRLVAPHCGQPLLPDTLLSPWSLSCSVSPQGSKTKRHPFPHHLGVLNTKAPSQTHGPFLCTGRGWGVAGPAALARHPHGHNFRPEHPGWPSFWERLECQSQVAIKGYSQSGRCRKVPRPEQLLLETSTSVRGAIRCQ